MSRGAKESGLKTRTFQASWQRLTKTGRPIRIADDWARRQLELAAAVSESATFAGFIRFHVARRLRADGGMVVALDNLNSYYDPGLKKARLAELAAYLGQTSVSP
jgi:hypothetical protein